MNYDISRMKLIKSLKICLEMHQNDYVLELPDNLIKLAEPLGYVYTLLRKTWD